MLNLNQRVDKFRQQYSRAEGVKQSFESRHDELIKECDVLSSQISVYEQTRVLLDLLVRSSEEDIQNYVEPVITEAVQYVFCKELFFHVIFASRRNQVENDFILLRNQEQEAEYQQYIGAKETYKKELEILIKGTRELDFMNGGAVAQVIAAVLRLTVCELLGIEGPVCLDEPSSAIGQEYTSRFGQLLYSLSRKFNRQIIMITHSDTLASFGDKVYRVNQDLEGSYKVSHVVLEKET